MRKTLVILIAMLYLLVSTGVHLHVHMCCGSVTEIGFQLPDNACCTGESENSTDSTCCSKNGCCSTIDVNIQIEDEHQAANPLRIQANATEVIVAGEDASVPSCVTSTGKKTQFADSGPPLRVPAYILYKSLITYS